MTPLLYLDDGNDERHSMAAALLAAGADVNAASTRTFLHPWRGSWNERPSGTTFLHMHVEARCARRCTGVPDCVQLALRAGANPSAVDGLQRTPLDLASGACTIQALITAQQQQQQLRRQQQQQQQLRRQQQQQQSAVRPPPPPVWADADFPPLPASRPPPAHHPPAAAPQDHHPSAPAPAPSRPAAFHERGGPKFECRICMEEVAELVALVPCGHRVMCAACAQGALSSGSCPICRTPTTAVMRIFD